MQAWVKSHHHIALEWKLFGRWFYDWKWSQREVQLVSYRNAIKRNYLHMLRHFALLFFCVMTCCDDWRGSICLIWHGLTAENLHWLIPPYQSPPWNKDWQPIAATWLLDPKSIPKPSQSSQATSRAAPWYDVSYDWPKMAFFEAHDLYIYIYILYIVRIYIYIYGYIC